MIAASNAVSSTGPLRGLAPFLRDAYELLIVLLLGWLATAPLHAAYLDHRNVRRTLDGDTVAIRGEGLEVGERLPAYRFHAGWQVPIGSVRVERLEGEDAVVSAEPGNRWSLGRQGRIVGEAAGTVVVDVGSELGLEPGQNLGVYDGRRWLGDVQLTAVSPQRSEASVSFAPERPLAGLEVTEFTVMTQVVVRDEPPLAVAAQVVLGLGPALAWVVVRRRRGVSPLGLLGDRLRAAAAAHPKLPLLVEALAVAVLLGLFLPSAACRIVALAAASVHAWVPALPVFDPWPLVEPWKRLTFALAAAWGVGYVAATGRSTLGAVSAAVAFERSPVARVPERLRPAVGWVLHLPIAWAFGAILLGFLHADVRSIATLFGDSGPASWPAAFQIATLTLWSFTVLGCLLGYLHTVFGPLFGKRIRQVDFTLAGWITNGACYPLLGVAMLRLVWPRPGPDPVVVGGFCGGFLLVVGLLANLAYTSAIWTMGTKFGVMTDKGLVTRGWFRVVRHPCYTFEVAMFLTLEASGLTTWHEWVGALSIGFLYWLRSEREDAFMAASNPDYARYREAVPYRYLPGVW